MDCYTGGVVTQQIKVHIEKNNRFYNRPSQQSEENYLSKRDWSFIIYVKIKKNLTKRKILDFTEYKNILTI